MTSQLIEHATQHEVDQHREWLEGNDVRIRDVELHQAETRGMVKMLLFVVSIPGVAAAVSGVVGTIWFFTQ
jgi:hypothetical protein